ncbi:hypothetical protein LJ737_14170 [Hymenobacter sp. 15J16-1T3B]|uniref:hypothetical protein n=1 Tax=Hymenobacter sp. 15J16-1T3B TaxID=2886941 RepID=UPI001D108745|nr:hypothetical protein [Hymenobacter sp. 15J16-1T3B]MCC3158391.1 hypothetical protein [Hymenobacter sp. 15J16-1T3B]
MGFSGDEGSLISLEAGVEMTTVFREEQPTQNKGVFFGKAMLTELLNQAGAKGLRFYFAYDETGKMTLVTVAADGEGKDILDRVGNKGEKCPDNCCAASPLCNGEA